MAQDLITIDVQAAPNGAQVFAFHGSLDIATSPTVRAALLDAADRGQRELIIDLTRLEFLDSTGLGALIGAHKRAKETTAAALRSSSKRVRSCACSDHRTPRRVPGLFDLGRSLRGQGAPRRVVGRIRVVEQLDDVLDRPRVPAVA